MLSFIQRFSRECWFQIGICFETNMLDFEIKKSFWNFATYAFYVENKFLTIYFCDFSLAYALFVEWSRLVSKNRLNREELKMKKSREFSINFTKNEKVDLIETIFKKLCQKRKRRLNRDSFQKTIKNEIVDLIETVFKKFYQKWNYAQSSTKFSIWSSSLSEKLANKQNKKNLKACHLYTTDV